METSRWRLAAVWGIAGTVAGPAGVLLHELGHYATAVALGFPEAALQFASISYANSEAFWQALARGERDAAAAIYPLANAGAVSIAGPAVTIALSLLCALILLMRERADDAIAAFAAATALTAGVRGLTSFYYMFWVKQTYPNARPFFDEINAARAFDIQIDWFAWPSAACFLVCWAAVLPRLTPGLWVKLPVAVVAPIVGILVWSQVGPLLMP